MTGYTKLFSSILGSTIWREDADTRLVWITLLAMANKDGIAEASVPGLADFARVSVDGARRALIKLMSPDPDSRTKEHDGRRVEEVDGGWRLLNHAKYREKMSEAERREYKRVKQAEYRQRGHGVADVDNCGQALPIVDAVDTSRSRSRSIHREQKQETPTVSLRAAPTTSDDGSAGNLWELFRTKALMLRGATLPLSCRVAEYASLTDFLARYPDTAKQAWLIDQFFTSSHRPITSSPVSIGQLCKWAPWLEAQTTATVAEPPRTAGNRAAADEAIRMIRAGVMR